MTTYLAGFFQFSILLAIAASVLWRSISFSRSADAHAPLSVHVVLDKDVARPASGEHRGTSSLAA
jgi:hypothetical protein